MRPRAGRRLPAWLGLAILCGCAAAPPRLRRDAGGIPFDHLMVGTPNWHQLGQQTALTIEASGAVVYRRQSYLDDPEGPEVGLYETALREGERDRIEADLAAFGFGVLAPRPEVRWAPHGPNRRPRRSRWRR